MLRSRPVRAMVVAAVAILATVLTGTAASAASADRTPPTTPSIGYAQGFYCFTAIVGAVRSTDNVTPQSQIRYEAFANGVFYGTLVDRGQPPGPWGTAQMKNAKVGPAANLITVQAVDAAGNRSAMSKGVAVDGFFTPGCTPYHF
jgi:hypothetical protein